MHSDQIQTSIELARATDGKDFIDIYWYSVAGRWPTQRERARMKKVGYVYSVSRGLRNEFPEILESDATVLLAECDRIEADEGE